MILLTALFHYILFILFLFCIQICNGTYVYSQTNTPTPSPSDTPAAAVTDTPTPTTLKTDTPTPTPSPLPPTATHTFTYTLTPTNTATLTHTDTPSATYTKTSTKTFTLTSTSTYTPTLTFTFTSTNTPTSTFTFTYTPSQTANQTSTPTDPLTNTSTETATPTFTSSPTVTNTITPTNTEFSTHTPTFSFTPTLTNTITPTSTLSPSKTPTITNTQTATFTPQHTNPQTPSFTHTSTKTYTPTFTFTSIPNTQIPNTPSYTPTLFFTNTYTPTQTYTLTTTNTAVSTPTGTYTPSATNTNTPTTTHTPIQSTPSPTDTILNPDNKPPNIFILQELPILLTVGIQSFISIFIIDPDEDVVNVEVLDMDHVDRVSVQSSGSNTVVTLEVNSIIASEFNIRILVSDGFESITIDVPFIARELQPTPTTPIPTNTSTQTKTKTSFPTATFTNTNTFIPLPTSTLTSTPTFTYTPTITPSNTPTTTPTHTPSLTPTSTFTATLFPTRIPAAPILMNIPDLKFALHQSVLHVLDLDDYVWDSDTPVENLIWSIEHGNIPVEIIIEQDNLLTVLNPNQVGLFPIQFSVTDGQFSASKDVVVKISSFIFSGFHVLPPVALQAEKPWISDYSLHQFLIPSDLPLEQVVIEPSFPLPNEIESLDILPDGRIQIIAEKDIEITVNDFQLIGKYISPTPVVIIAPTFTSLPTPTFTLPPTRTSTHTFTPTFTATNTPTRTPTATHTHINISTPNNLSPTPSALPDVVLQSCAGSISFREMFVESTGVFPVDLFVDDINQDDIPEIMIANYGTNTASLWHSKNSLQFDPQLIQAGEGVINTLLHKLEDGIFAFVLSGIDPELRLYDLGNSSPVQLNRLAFRQEDFPSASVFPEELSLLTKGKFLGTNETLFAIARSNAIFLYRTGDLRLEIENTIPITQQVTKINALDIDGDSLDEIAAVTTLPNHLIIIDAINQERIVELNFDQPLSGNRVIDMEVGDLNSDNIDDIVLFTFSQDLVIVFGGETPRVQTVDTMVDAVFKSVTVGDYDGNQQNDIMITGLDLNLEEPVLAIFCADNEGHFSLTSQVILPRTFSVNQFFDIKTADMNVDGKPDIVLLDRDQEEVVIYINQSEI